MKKSAAILLAAVIMLSGIVMMTGCAGNGSSGSDGTADNSGSLSVDNADADSPGAGDLVAESRQNSLIPTDAECEALVAQFKAENGIASNEPFLTCKGATLQDYPDSAEGYINSRRLDIDGDEGDEIVVLCTEKGEINPLTFMVKIYKYDGNSFSLVSETSVAPLDYCDEVAVEVYYNTVLDAYCIGAERTTVGAYTGTRESQFNLFKIEKSGIPSAAGMWSWNNFDDSSYNTIGSIETKMNEVGVVHSRYICEINKASAENKLGVLGKSTITIDQDDDGWVTVDSDKYMTLTDAG